MESKQKPKQKQKAGSKLILNSKVAKYYKNVQKGLNKKEAALKAGYSLNTAQFNTPKIEQSLAYQQVERALSYKDEILKKTTLEEIAREQLSVVFQNENLNAKNVAIKQVVDTIEPENRSDDGDDRVIIVLKGE